MPIAFSTLIHVPDAQKWKEKLMAYAYQFVFMLSPNHAKDRKRLILKAGKVIKLKKHVEDSEALKNKAATTVLQGWQLMVPSAQNNVDRLVGL